MTQNRKSQLQALHYKLAKGPYKDLFVDLVWTHSDIVRQSAIIIMDDLETKCYSVDRDLVEEAALSSLKILNPCLGLSRQAKKGILCSWFSPRG